MTNVLDTLGLFSTSAFTIFSGFVGLFLFLLMILTGWVERERRPLRSRFLIIGGMLFTVGWLWVQVISQLKGAIW